MLDSLAREGLELCNVKAWLALSDKCCCWTARMYTRKNVLEGGNVFPDSRPITGQKIVLEAEEHSESRIVLEACTRGSLVGAATICM